MPVGIWLRIRLVCASTLLIQASHTLFGLFQMANKRQNYLVCAVHTSFASYEPASLNQNLARLSLWWATQGGEEAKGSAYARVTCRAKEIHLLTIWLRVLALSLVLRNFPSKSREELLISTICFGLLSLLAVHGPIVITWGMGSGEWGLGTAIHVLLKHANTLFYLIRIYPLATWRAFPTNFFHFLECPLQHFLCLFRSPKTNADPPTYSSPTPPSAFHIFIIKMLHGKSLQQN